MYAVQHVPVQQITFATVQHANLVCKMLFVFIYWFNQMAIQDLTTDIPVKSVKSLC